MSLPPLPNVIGERYRPIRLLGKGGGGAVYEAEHLHTGARVALKLLAGFEGASPEVVARFRREARLAAAIDSEHVVRITDAGTAEEMGGTPFLVMELMQGHTLEYEAREPVPPERVVELLTQVARALERAHAAGIIHRDLKPDNMFLTQREDGRPWVKLLDFGIAKNTGQVPQGSAGSTEQGTVLGTPIYMSPEQAQGQASLLDARTDTWALGMIAFRLLFGVPYFAPDHTLRLLHRVVFEPVQKPSELGFVASPEFDAWFQRSCSHDRAQRYVSPAEQIRHLGVALAGLQQVEVRKHMLEARALRYSASTEQQAPSELEAGLSTPASPWSDGPMLQQSSDSDRRPLAGSYAESTPKQISLVPPRASRAPISRAIPLTFAAFVLLAAATWLWRVTRSVPLTDESGAKLEAAPAAVEPREPAPTRAGASEGSPNVLPVTDAAAPLPKSSENRGELPPPVRRPPLPPHKNDGRGAGRAPKYDPLGDRH
ncbi:MAG: serine/threonine-protein kinase [Myxococcales bacterium]